MSNSLFQSGIYEHGYGMIAKQVMRDTDLSIEAKSIYAYLCSFAGAGKTAFPSVELIIAELNISRERFYNHRKKLIEKGYIQVVTTKNDKGQQQKNTYQILNRPNPQSQNPTTEKPQSGYPQSGDLESGGPQSDNQYSNSNSLKSNSLKSNNINNNSNSAAAKTEYIKLYSELPKIDQQAVAEISADLTRDPIEYYLDKIGNLNPIQVEDICYSQADFGPQGIILTNFAIYHAGIRGIRSYGLLRDILREWSQHNIQTIAAAIAYEESKKHVGGGKNGMGRRNRSSGGSKSYNWN